MTTESRETRELRSLAARARWATPGERERQALRLLEFNDRRRRDRQERKSS